MVALVHRVETLTEASGSYTLTLVPHVHVSGKVGTMPLHTTYTPDIKFSLSRVEVQPLISEAVAAEGAEAAAFSPSQAGSTEGKRDQPLYVSFGVAHMTVSSARRIGLIGLALIGYALLIALALVRPRYPDEASAIQARYGRLIVPVERVWPLPGVPVIDVADMDALVRIAGHYERSILHEVTPEGDAFWVTDESGQFRYPVGGQRVAAPEEFIEQPTGVLFQGEQAPEEPGLEEAVFGEQPTPPIPPVAEEPFVAESWPAADQPVADQPAVESWPAVEQPVANQPVPESWPVVDQPVVDQPVVDQPVVAESWPAAAEQPVAESWPEVQQPVAESWPEAQEPVAESWPAAEQQVAESWHEAQEPVVANAWPAAGQPVAGEAVAYEHWQATGAPPTLSQEAVAVPVVDGASEGGPQGHPDPGAGDQRSGPHRYRGRRPLDRISRRWVRPGR